MHLAEIQRIKLWQVEHRRMQPLEYHAWDAVLTVWLMGWVGWLPVFAFDAVWLMPLCLAGMAAPGAYASWRARLKRTPCSIRPSRSRHRSRRPGTGCKEAVIARS